MNAVGTVSGPAFVNAQTPSAEAVATPLACLLPESEAPALGELQDAMAQLQLMLSKMRDGQQEKGKVEVARAKDARKLQEQKEQEALERAREEAEEGFFESDFFKAAVVVCAVAASVVTCGTAAGACLALAAVALSVGGGEVAKSGCLDDVFGEGTSKYIGLAMQIVGAAASAGSGFLASGAALETVGVAASTAKDISTGTAIVNGGMQVAKGTAQVATAVKEHDRAQANIDATAARKQLARLQKMVELVIDGMKEAKESHQRAAETLSGAIETANQTDVALAQGVRV